MPPENPPGTNYFIDVVARDARRLVGAASGDLTLRTTLDLELQAIAENVIARRLKAEGRAKSIGQAALVAMTPDGAILAMVGGLDYNESQFNRATQARRQPGSLFKLFVYLAALEQGFSPQSTMVDRPVRIGNWEPENYDAETIEPYAIDTMQSGDRVVFARQKTVIKPPSNPTARSAIRDLLAGVVREGRGRAAKVSVPAAGKTGTSQEYRNAWFVGFTPDLVVGVWVGNDDNSPMRNVMGGDVPARIWNEFVTQASAARARSARTRPVTVGAAIAPTVSPQANASAVRGVPVVQTTGVIDGKPDSSLRGRGGPRPSGRRDAALSAAPGSRLRAAQRGQRVPVSGR